jgi:hypothetical protein
MNQKNIFTVIAAILVLQGLAFFFMGGQLMSDSFSGVDETGLRALTLLFELPAALSIAVGLIAYASRSNPGVVWAFTLGTVILMCVTLKHIFIDDIKVPVPAIIIQVLIVLACGYLLTQGKKA